MQLDAKVAVVTGGGSGIGRALCLALASKGVTVAPCDLNEESAAETVLLMEKAGLDKGHHSWQLDVSDREQFDELGTEIIRHYGRVDIVVNNAGVLGEVAPISMLSYEELEWILGIDLWGVIHGTKTFVPHLLERPAGALVNVSSLAGIMGSLGNSAYFAAKFAVRGFTEAVRSELLPSKVRVSLVIPGIVKTNLAANSLHYSEEEKAQAVRLYHSQPGISAERAAARIVRGIEKGSPRILLGPDAWAIDKLVRLFPGRADRIVDPVARRMANKQRLDGRTVF
jgi:NAD(P)-dependent dehydrogenase (short-subunit alcohol dehydrogenase family)